MMSRFISLVAVALGCLLCVQGRATMHNLTDKAEQYLVQNLPNEQLKLNFKLYAGYFQGFTKFQQMFFMFAESQNNPSTDPLVLWLNGGPGCSSLFGAMTENGPFRLKNFKLEQNPFSWNKFANVLYLDSPVGTGFSYDTRGRGNSGDLSTMDDIIGALDGFFINFPHFRDREFYLAGQGYAAVHAALVVLQRSKQFNIKGMAIGNAYLDHLKYSNGLITYIFQHGLVSRVFRRKMLQACCRNVEDVSRCNYVMSQSLMCQYFVKKIHNLFNSKFNVYNIYANCDPENTNLETSPEVLDITAEDEIELKKLEKTTNFKPLSLDYKQLFFNRSENAADDSLSFMCYNHEEIVNFFRQPNIRKRFHVSPEAKPWGICSKEVLVDYIPTYPNMEATYFDLMNKTESSIKLLMYNGDTSAILPFTASEWFFDDLNLKLKAKYRPWYYTDENNWKQVGGWYKVYQKNSNVLTYTNVRGAGYFVPTDKPRAMYDMFYKWLKKNKL